MKTIIILASFILSLFSVSGCTKVDENAVLPHVKVYEFNNVPGQCMELEKNTEKIAVYKLGHTYKYKAIFEDTLFSITKHLSSHKDDVAMTVTTGDKTTVRVVILTDSLPTYGYLSAGYE